MTISVPGRPHSKAIGIAWSYLLRRIQLGARDRLAPAPLGSAVREPRAACAKDQPVGKPGKRGATDEAMEPRAGRSPRAGSGGVDVARIATPGEEHAPVLQEHGLRAVVIGHPGSQSPPDRSRVI